MSAKTIILKAAELTVRKEGIAGGTITPGDLVDALPNGAVSRQGAADASAQKAFALERDVTGDDIDTDYAANDTVMYALCSPGVEVNANVGGAITAGDILESGAAGILQGVTTGRQIARAIETVAGAGRCKVEVL